MRKGFAFLAALVLVPAATAAARPALPVEGLVRIASALTALRAPSGVSVEVVSGGTLKARAQTSIDTRYPPSLQTYDQTLYRALGVLGPAEPIRPALLRAFADRSSAVVDVRHRIVSVPRAADMRATAVQGLVRLLQDSRYLLTPRIAAARGSSDAAEAAFAAASGAAQIASRSLRSTPPAAAPPRTRAAAFLQLEAAFPGAVGARLAANLYNVGGRAALDGLLRRLPTSSEQVFHVDKYLAREEPAAIELPASAAGFSLSRHDSFGELDVRALLAVFEVPRLDRVGAGWGGGLSALYRDATGGQAVALRLDWDNERDAQEWQEAVATYVNEAFDAEVPGPAATTPCAADTCWDVGARQVAFVREGARTALVVAAGVPVSAALGRALVP
jgi:hypothetical protein